MKYAETTDESWNADTTALRVTGQVIRILR